MCCKHKSRSSRNFGPNPNFNHGPPNFHNGPPNTPLGRLVRHIIEKKQAKNVALSKSQVQDNGYGYKALADQGQGQGQQTYGQVKREEEMRWVDEKQDAVFPGRGVETVRGRVSQETYRTELPSYGQVMKQ